MTPTLAEEKAQKQANLKQLTKSQNAQELAVPGNTASEVEAHAKTTNLVENMFKKLLGANQ